MALQTRFPRKAGFMPSWGTSLVFSAVPDVSRAHGSPLHSAQLASILVCLLAILMLMWHTFLFSYGLLGLLCTRFQPLFAVVPLYFIITLAFRTYRLAHWPIDNNLLVLIQNDQSYLALYYLHRVTALAYYVVAIRTTHVLGEHRFYRSIGWLG